MPRRKKALSYQVAVSIPILAGASWGFGETITHVPGLLSISLLAYQAIWVVGCTFVLWFALVKTYSASKLSAFTFITPLFGVVRRLVHPARQTDDRLRCRRAARDRGALSHQQAGSEGDAGSQTCRRDGDQLGSLPATKGAKAHGASRMT